MVIADAFQAEKGITFFLSTMNGTVSVFHIHTKMSSKFYDFRLVKTDGGI